MDFKLVKMDSMAYKNLEKATDEQNCILLYIVILLLILWGLANCYKRSRKLFRMTEVNEIEIREDLKNDKKDDLKNEKRK
jgi:hypothetical protein